MHGVKRLEIQKLQKQNPVGIMEIPKKDQTGDTAMKGTKYVHRYSMLWVAKYGSSSRISRILTGPRLQGREEAEKLGRALADGAGNDLRGRDERDT